MAAEELADQVGIEPALIQEVREFVIERLRHYYREQGHDSALISAVFASDWDTLPDLENRLKALSGFMGQESAESLASANKRIGNILRKSDTAISNNIDEELLHIEEERTLFDEIISMEKLVTPLLEQSDYKASLKLLAGLRAPVDNFFDAVMVMDEDTALRDNRLALLTRLKSLFDRIADLSVLA
jgi:glycyl-tRNA synthetase beta chain